MKWRKWGVSYGSIWRWHQSSYARVKTTWNDSFKIFWIMAEKVLFYETHKQLIKRVALLGF